MRDLYHWFPANMTCARYISIGVLLTQGLQNFQQNQSLLLHLSDRSVSILLKCPDVYVAAVERL